MAEAHGALSPFIKRVTSNVTDNVLEIRFTWAGKGTTAIPASGVYGPLISAISVEPSKFSCNFRQLCIDFIPGSSFVCVLSDFGFQTN